MFKNRLQNKVISTFPLNYDIYICKVIILRQFYGSGRDINDAFDDQRLAAGRASLLVFLVQGMNSVPLFFPTYLTRTEGASTTVHKLHHPGEKSSPVSTGGPHISHLFLTGQFSRKPGGAAGAGKQQYCSCPDLMDSKQLDRAFRIISSSCLPLGRTATKSHRQREVLLAHTYFLCILSPGLEIHQAISLQGSKPNVASPLPFCCLIVV